MASSIVLSDNGVTSGSAGIKSTGGNDGVLLLQTTTAGGSATTAVTVDNAQNVGVGVTPSAWPSGQGAMQLKNGGLSAWALGGVNGYIYSNAYYDGSNNRYINNGFANSYAINNANGIHAWFNAASGTAGNAITFTQAMTLDASGNLLVGTTSGSSNTIQHPTQTQGNVNLSLTNGGQFFVCGGANGNVAATGFRIPLNNTTNRSINAGGSINASGADYAEYMIKAGDFAIAKGDVVGINADGKLTNVFASAVTFVVKSTDPAYIGGDTWGVGFEDDKDGLEAARQTVDRIAFAGQVPVNVTGATAGQYIIPVNDNGAIKGEAVSNPTFEQYQQTVGKVIAIEQDGRARIIVKVA